MNRRDHFRGWTAIFYAIHNENVPVAVVDFLIAEGADLELIDYLDEGLIPHITQHSTDVPRTWAKLR